MHLLYYRGMTNNSFQYYIDRYLDGTISKEEWKTLRGLMDDPKNASLLDQLIDQQFKEAVLEPASFPGVTERVIKGVQSKLDEERVDQPVARERIHFLRSAWLRYAASVILLLGTGTFLFIRNQSRKQPGLEQTAPISGISPGGNKAVLTLGDGSTIVLDHAANGALAQQGNVSIIKVDSGRLAYNSSRNSKGQPVTYNTISTPRGGQYQVVLSDGTKVWLNTASSIKFPTAFSEKERRVEIEGEAYFEVQHNATRPFLVTAGGMNIQVLGTSFNINAYPDEGSLRTTLIDGSVRVATRQTANTAGKMAILKPGQQAILSRDPLAGRSGEGFTIDDNADLEEATAWKNGYFYFKHADIPTVMRQIARWYDLSIEYQGAIPDMKFGGDIPRNASAAEVWKILEKSRLKFSVEGKKIIVKP